MTLILGIDTGGTYTDSVLMRQEDGRILSMGKELTTRGHLIDGIAASIGALDSKLFGEVVSVVISTTLATNAVVEAKRSKTLLFIMGNEEIDIPGCQIVRIKGRMDIMGNILADPEKAQVGEVLRNLPCDVKAAAVSGYASVRNPKHEQMVEEWIREMTELPVVCGHQLTSALGFAHRTVTAVLNAGLISVIGHLLADTRNALNRVGITAPMMIVRGDGTLMSEKAAAARPIETILSGPAASVSGAMGLTGLCNGLIVDMGGTTTDIGHLRDGGIRINEAGAKVGGWSTRVKAVSISTFGIGGDSKLFLQEKGKLGIGPERVVPLCRICEQYKNLVYEIRDFRRIGELKAYFRDEADCFLLAREPDGQDPRAQRVAAVLRDGPHSISVIADKLGMDPERLNLDDLVADGILTRCSLTPTDILHALGRLALWDLNGSWAGIRVLAHRAGIAESEWIRLAENAIVEKLAVACIQSAVDFDGRDYGMDTEEAAFYLLQKSFYGRKADLLQAEIRLGEPIIAIGAPAAAWMRRVGELLYTDVIVPEYAEVANAYGAAAGEFAESLDIRILNEGTRLLLILPWERKVLKSREEALFIAVHEGRRYLEHRMAEAGYDRVAIREELSDERVRLRPGDEEETIISTRLRLTAVADRGFRRFG